MYIVYFWSYPNWLEFSGIAKQEFVLSRTDASPFLKTPNFLIAATPDEEKKKDCSNSSTEAKRMA